MVRTSNIIYYPLVSEAAELRWLPSCKKVAKKSPPQNPDAAVWEVSDGVMTTTSWGPNRTKYKPYMCHALCLSMSMPGNNLLTSYRGASLR